MSPVTRSRWNLSTIAVLVTWSLTVIGAVWAASADRAGLGRSIEEHGQQIGDHEARLRGVEKDLHQVAADVRWIRQRMEKQP